jgi:UDP-hydrolysing UDP-N-acetyl-D-glucosamine 2-epimerase
MVGMRKILVLSADRAERGLLEPVMAELSHVTVAQWCEIPSNTYEGIFKLRDMIESFKPDIVVVPCDREEMVYSAAYAFHHGQVVAHFHAGNLGSDHPDEMNRRAISCFSHILLCNTEEDKKNLVKLGEEEWRCHVVGSTAFDNINYDYTLCPNYPYALVLLHPDPDPEQTKKDLQETIAAAQDYYAVAWLAPNHDLNHEIIRSFMSDYRNFKSYFPKAWQTGIEMENLQRETFLGLLRKCQVFIGNSSAIFYEAPLFEVKTISVGKRNKGRNPIQVVPGGSKRIAELLAKVSIDEKLRRKRFSLDTLL